MIVLTARREPFLSSGYSPYANFVRPVIPKDGMGYILPHGYFISKFAAAETVQIAADVFLRVLSAQPSHELLLSRLSLSSARPIANGSRR